VRKSLSDQGASGRHVRHSVDASEARVNALYRAAQNVTITANAPPIWLRRLGDQVCFRLCSTVRAHRPEISAVEQVDERS